MARPPELVIAAKDLRQRVRDRSVLVLGFIAPLVIAALMSLAFQATQRIHVTVAVVDLDHGPVAAGLRQVLGQPAVASLVTVTTAPSQASANQQVRSGRVGAAVVIPPGFSAAALGPHPKDLVTLTSVKATIAAQIAEALTSSFTAQLNADRLSAVTAGGGNPSAALAADVARLRIPLTAVADDLNAKPLKVISYYAPSMAIFFLLFTIGFTSRNFFVERTQGTLERMAAAPLRPVQVLTGKAVSVLVYGTASLLTVALVTSLAFGADWGQPLPAVVVSLAMVISVVALTALVIGLARSQRQAESFASTLVFALALLGGNFVFVSAEPALLQHLALFTPNGLALRAYTDMATTGAGFSVAALPVLGILAFSAVVGAIALVLAPRAVKS